MVVFDSKDKELFDKASAVIDSLFGMMTFSDEGAIGMVALSDRVGDLFLSVVFGDNEQTLPISSLSCLVSRILVIRFNLKVLSLKTILSCPYSTVRKVEMLTPR